MSLPYVCAFMVMIALLVPTVLAYLVASVPLLKLLERQHTGQFHAIGSPSPWTLNVRVGQFTFASWLLKRSYLSLRDAEVERRAGRARKILLVMLILQAIAVICALLALSRVLLMQ